MLSYKIFQEQKTIIPELQNRLYKLADRTLMENKKQIDWFTDKLHLLDPVNLLLRGFSITLANGKTVRSVKTLEKGQRIETLLHDGKVESMVE